MSVRRRGLLARVMMLVVVLLAGGAFPSLPVRAAGAFYTAPTDLGGHSPGDLLRSEELPPDFPGARVFRLLYVSTTSGGDLVAVSGLLAIPTTPAPPEGYPMAAVGHGSVGVGRECAPSIDPSRGTFNGPASYDLFVAPLVDAGYVVVMSDLQGLGVPGPSSYLVGDIEGRNILDSARAAFAFPDAHLQPRVILWGQSQGGHAALFAASMAPVYAPELALAAVVAEAPPTDLAGMYTTLLADDARGGIVSLPLMTIDAWLRQYPEIAVDAVLTPRGRTVLREAVASRCLSAAFFLTQPYRPSDLIRPGALARLGLYVEANTPVFGPYSMPVLITQGGADELVLPRATARFVAGMCRAGTDVTYRSYPGAGHVEVIDAANADVLAWMANVRDGATPSGCR